MKLCSFPGCGRGIRARGNCQQHDRQEQRGEPLRPLKQYRSNKGQTCYLSGCDRPARGLGLCDSHLRRYLWARRAGTLELGYWKTPVRYVRRGDTVGLTARWPRGELARLERYAESRGITRASALVELALRAMAEIWPARRAA